MEWHTINEEDAASLNFLYPFIDVYPQYFQERFGFVPKVAMELKKDHVRYLLHDSFVRQMPALYDWLCKKGSFETLEAHVNAESEQLHRQSDAVLAKNLRKMDDRELSQEAVDLSDRLCSLVGWGLLPPLIDFAGGHISQAAMGAIETKIKNRGLKCHPSEYFVTLTTPRKNTHTRQEERSLLDLAKKYRQAGMHADQSFEHMQKRPGLQAATRRHAERFVWTYFGYCGPALTEHDTFKKAQALLQDDRLEEKIEKQRNGLSQLEKKQDQYQRELSMDAAQTRAVHIARQSVWLKIVRKDAMVHAAYALDGILREVARRTGIPRSHVRAAKSDELDSVLDGTLTAENLAQRHAHVIYQCDENGTALWHGKKAASFSETHIQTLAVGDHRHLQGQCARPGKATGRVKIIDKAEQMDKMENGDILVSIATTPEIVPAMKKAAAIVCDIGGITSHAAIVSRELGVPCVIGTKIATKWLNDGDCVEVDATEGIVRKIRQ